MRARRAQSKGGQKLFGMQSSHSSRGCGAMKEDTNWTVYVPQKQEAIDLRERSSGNLRHPIDNLYLPKRKGDEAGLAARMAAFAMDQEFWLAERSHQALVSLHIIVEVNPEKLGGVPVFRGTRFSIAQFFTEVADSQAIHDIADNFELNENELRTFLHHFATYVNKPLS